MTDDVVVSLNVLGGGPPDSPPGIARIVDQDLLDTGWIRRHSTDPARAEEYVNLYRELGFETCTRELTVDEYDYVCRECVLRTAQRHVMIYTRRVSGGAAESKQGTC